jgi:hypothetical protein
MRSADRERTVKLIRTALRLRSGKAWSVSIGRGTARGWITITAPPARHWNGHMSLDDYIQRALYGTANGFTASPYGDCAMTYAQRLRFLARGQARRVRRPCTAREEANRRWGLCRALRLDKPGRATRPRKERVIP